MKYGLLFACCALFFSACTVDYPLDGTNPPGKQQDRPEPRQHSCSHPLPASVVDFRVIKVRNDPYQLQEVTLKGDVLCATVEYGGGCEQHDFHLLVDEAIMESYPPQVNVMLTHNDHGDMCDALLTSTVGFDLTPLKEHLQAATGQASGTVLLRIGDREPIAYAY